MSQSMDMTAGPLGDIAPPSNNRWWVIAAGVGVAVVLGYGAALIATGHLPGTDHTVAAPVAAVVAPQLQDGAVSSGTVDPFEAQVASPQTQAAAGQLSSPSVVSEYLGRSRELSPQAIAELRGEAMVEYFASQSLGAAVAPVDSFEAQFASPEVQAAVGIGSLAPRSIVPAQSIAGADDLATRAAVGASGVVAQSYAGVDDFATRLMASEAIRYAGVDDFATRFMASEAIR